MKQLTFWDMLYLARYLKRRHTPTHLRAIILVAAAGAARFLNEQ